jgi:hypothetical protein
MGIGMIVILYQIYAERIAGTSDFILLAGDDFHLLDHTNFLLLGI